MVQLAPFVVRCVVSRTDFRYVSPCAELTPQIARRLSVGTPHAGNARRVRMAIHDAARSRSPAVPRRPGPLPATYHPRFPRRVLRPRVGSIRGRCACARHYTHTHKRCAGRGSCGTDTRTSAPHVLRVARMRHACRPPPPLRTIIPHKSDIVRTT